MLRGVAIIRDRNRMRDFSLAGRLVREVFSRRVFYPLNRKLLRLALAGLGVNNWTDHQRDELRYLKRLRNQFGPAPVIVDVGAHLGEYAMLARETFPQATIFSFEPNPAAFSKLRERTAELSLTV